MDWVEATRRAETRERELAVALQAVLSPAGYDETHGCSEAAPLTPPWRAKNTRTSCESSAAPEVGPHDSWSTVNAEQANLVDSWVGDDRGPADAQASSVWPAVADDYGSVLHAVADDYGLADAQCAASSSQGDGDRSNTAQLAADDDAWHDDRSSAAQ